VNRFILTIEASVNTAAGAAPVLDILVDGIPVTSSSGITALTGVGSDLLVFTLDFTGSYPTSLSFRFNAGSGDGGDNVTLDAVRINGQAVDSGDLTATILAQGQTADIVSTAALEHLFGRTEPDPADLGPVTDTGTGGDDGNLSGSQGEDVIDGAGGNDRIRGLGDDDAINGNDGNDQIFGENGNDIIIGGNGDDKLNGNAGDDLLYGQGDNDNIWGDAGNDVLNGGAGNDVLTAGAGNDILFGEAGDDRLIGVSGQNSMYGDAGNDVLLGGAGVDTMFGGDDDDQLNGAAGNDVMDGEAGSDFLNGGAGNDTMSGGTGDDTMYGGAGDDTANGGDNDDLIYGEAGTDTLSGDAGNDSIFGGDGADTLNGGAGNDILQGAGLATAEISTILRSNSGVTYSHETGSFYKLVSASVTFAGAQSVAGAEVINGVSGHLVTISSSVENAFVNSLAAGNQIWLNASDGVTEGKWRWAGGNEDGMLLWNGDQTGSAENGFYTNWAGGQPGGGDSADAAVMLSDATWDDVSATSTNYYVIEWDGSDFSDDNLADALNGGDDNDLLVGNGGDDVLHGDAGTDHIFGSDGNDVMYGDADNDYLYDDAGANEFDGGTGDDTLDARFQTAVPTIAEQISTILSQNPTLNYSADTVNFYALVTGNYTFDQTVSGSEASLINGIGGHLVTITSDEENTLVSSLRLGNEIWIGASDDTAYSGDVEGEWYWVTGPEAGTHFYTQGVGAVGGAFIAWDAGEPNDYVNGEDYATMWQGGDRWNDNGPPNSAGFTADYMIEWEGSDLLTTPPVEAAQAGQIMNGGAGNDTIYGGNGGDTIDGGDDNDALYGGLGSDTISGGAGVDVLRANTDPSLSAIPLMVTFDADEDGFSYADGFTGVGGSDPGNITIDGSWASGDGNTANGSLEIYFNSTGNPTSAMSGSYTFTLNLATALDAAQLSFAYRMNLFTAADNGEDLFLYADVDGTQYGTGGNAWVDSREGNSTEGDSGWLTVVLDLGSLASGSHTITIGGYLTDVSDSSEDAWMRLDDISLSNGGAASVDDGAVNMLDGGDGNDTLYGSTGLDTLLGGNGDDTLRSGSDIAYTQATELTATFDADADGFTYADGFTGLGGSDGANVTVGGTWVAADGYAGGSGNGSVEVTMDSTANAAGPISGHYNITVNLAEDMTNTQLSFAYRMNLFTAADGGENLYLYASVDNTEYGTGGNAWADSRLGNSTEGDSGWLTVTLDVGALSAGNHTIRIGMYVNDVSDSSEDAWLRIDDVSLVGDVVDDTVFNALNGQDGFDQLYGSDGIDHFILEAASAYNDTDYINNFDAAGGDVLDLSDVLSGVGYNPLSDAITDFVRITDFGAHSIVEVDPTGTATFDYSIIVAGIINVTGLTNETALETAGTLITA